MYKNCNFLWKGKFKCKRNNIENFQEDENKCAEEQNACDRKCTQLYERLQYSPEYVPCFNTCKLIFNRCKMGR